jgi:hypothetical protein
MSTSAPPILWVKEGDKVLAGIRACLKVIQTLEQSPTQLTPPTPPSDEEQRKRRKKSSAPKQMISAADATHILRSQPHQHATDCFLTTVLPHLITVGERPYPAEVSDATIGLRSSLWATTVTERLASWTRRDHTLFTSVPPVSDVDVNLLCIIE